MKRSVRSVGAVEVVTLPAPVGVRNVHPQRTGRNPQPDSHGVLTGLDSVRATVTGLRAR